MISSGNKIYEEVGRGISTWAAMEGRLVQIAAKLLGSTEVKTGLILYSINNFYTWLNIIDGLLADGEHPEAKKLWSKAVKILKAQNDIRVRLAHQTVHLDFYESAEGKIAVRVEGLRALSLDTRPKTQKSNALSEKEIAEFTGVVGGLFDTLYKILLAIDRDVASHSASS